MNQSNVRNRFGAFWAEWGFAQIHKIVFNLLQTRKQDLETAEKVQIAKKRIIWAIYLKNINKYHIRNIIKIEHATLYMGSCPLNIFKLPTINHHALCYKKGSAPAQWVDEPAFFRFNRLFIVIFALQQLQQAKEQSARRNRIFTTYYFQYLSLISN